MNLTAKRLLAALLAFVMLAGILPTGVFASAPVAHDPAAVIEETVDPLATEPASEDKSESPAPTEAASETPTDTPAEEPIASPSPEEAPTEGENAIATYAARASGTVTGLTDSSIALSYSGDKEASWSATPNAIVGSVSATKGGIGLGCT